MQNQKPAVEVEIAVEAPKPPITIDRARRYFMESTTATVKNDRECKIDARYYHNDQIGADQRAKLKQRGQPIVIVNRIAPAISGILGIIDSAQTDPQCWPRTPEMQGTADIATKILRYLNDRADMERVMADLSTDYFIHGTCAALVGEEAFNGASEIGVTPIKWEDFFYDPMARDYDFRDARYLGVSQMRDADDVAILYPEQYKALGNPFDSGADWLDGKHSIEEEMMWLDRDRRRIRVVELYFKHTDGNWHRVVFCEAGFLDFGQSAYVNDQKQSICPIVAASYEVNRHNGDRYGPIRAMRYLQDEINSRRSKLLNETNNRRVQQVVEDVEEGSKDIAKREAAKADGALPYGWQAVSAPDIAEGQALLLNEAKADMDRLAPTPAVLGRMGAGDSGRARQVLQQAGYTEWARSFERLMKLEESINRHLWFGAKQFMTQPQWIRATGEARSTEWVQVNVPVDVKYVPDVDPQTGQPNIDPTTGQPHMIAQPVYDKAIAAMDVDIVLDTVPDSSTLEHETVQELLRYAGSTGISPLDPQFKALLMLFPLPNKTQTLEQWESVRKMMQEEQAAQMQAQQQQMMQQQQLQAAHIQAKAAKDTAQAHKAEADAMMTEMEIKNHVMAQQYAAMLAGIAPPPASPPFAQ